MAIGAGGHLLLLAMKVMGVDGGGLVWPGGRVVEMLSLHGGRPLHSRLFGSHLFLIMGCRMYTAVETKKRKCDKDAAAGLQKHVKSTFFQQCTATCMPGGKDLRHPLH
jgi:hypothetical protein